jgi:hypothetical protein
LTFKSGFVFSVKLLCKVGVVPAQQKMCWASICTALIINNKFLILWFKTRSMLWSHFSAILDNFLQKLAFFLKK